MPYHTFPEPDVTSSRAYFQVKVFNLGPKAIFFQNAKPASFPILGSPVKIG